MSKKIILLILFSYFNIGNVFSQNRGNIWMLSYQWFVNDCGIDFNPGYADTFSVWKNLEFFLTDAGICDTSGQMLFYTNGIWIANSDNDTLQNSAGFNPGWATDFYTDEGTGLGASQGALILPRPGSHTLFDVFHISGELVDSGTQTQPLQLRYSEVDMSLDSGLGGIVSTKKDLYLVEDTLVWGRLTACKHANGRDWWIISHRWNSNLYYKFLLTPDSILGPFTQNIGSIISKDDIFGQACFSQDGSKFCYLNRNFNFDYLKFNRCTGEFSDAINVLLPDSNTTQGCAFSSSGRFLYMNDFNQIFQFDTWSNDLSASEILVDTIPFVQIGMIPDWFAVEMLAPDNKIYISTYNGIEALHVINDPDSLGTACNFIRQGLILPTYNAYAIPNDPNYDLGPLDNSPCDTLNIFTQSISQKQFSVRINPNPTSDWLNITYQTNEDCILELLDMYGKRVAETSLYRYFRNRLINVSELPTGLYLANVVEKGERVWSQKIVVSH